MHPPVRDLSALMRVGEDNAVAWFFEGGRELTRGALQREAAAWARPDASHPKQLVAIVADQSPEAFGAVIGAMAAGHAVVILPPEPVDLRERVETSFDPNVVAMRRGGQWVLQTRHRRDLGLHPELALLLSTSGTTGECKFARLSYRNLLANADAIAEYLRLSPADCGLMNLPLHYSYGLSLVTSHLACGGRLVVSQRSVTDPDLWRLFDEQRCTSIAGVPHSYALMATSGFLERRLPTLRTMTQAGGRLPEPLARQFAQWSRERGVDFFIMYGQTEAAPRMAYLPPEAALAHGDCIGRAVPGGKLGLVDAQGHEIQEPGVEGELVYEGPNVMMGYAASAADLSLPSGPGLLKTGDLAVIDRASGFFRVTGRSSRFLKIFGLRISLDEVERRLELAGHAAACTGNDEWLGVVVRRPNQVQAGVRELAAAAAGLPLERVRVLVADAWPTLASGKTDHRAIKALFERETNRQEAAAGPMPAAATAAAAAGDAAVEPDAVRRIFEAALGRRIPDDKASFLDLGGDSLTYASAAIKLQRLIPDLPANWQSRSIASLQSMARRKAAPRRWWSLEKVETSVLVRAIAPVLVVVYHTGHQFLAGGAALLLLVAGYNVSRFMGPSLASGQWQMALRNLLLRVLIPFWLIATVVGIHHWNIPWRDLLLVGNLLESHKIDASGFETWFVLMVAQSMLFLMLVTQFEPIRRRFRDRPYLTALLLVGFAVCLRQLEPHVLPRLMGNGGREFPWVFWLFALGMLVHVSQRLDQRALTTIVLIALVAFLLRHDLPRVVMITTGALALLWVDNAKLPRFLVPAVGITAAASFFIYLLHLRAPVHSFTSAWPLDIVRVMAGIGLGIAGWWLYDRFVAAVAARAGFREAPAVAGTGQLVEVPGASRGGI